MKINHKRTLKNNFPLGLYFQQLFSPNAYVKFFNPFSFWRRYKTNHLENCWEINTVRYLERCHKLEYRKNLLTEDPESRIELTATGTYRGVPWQKTTKNTIFVSQTPLKLKYRGVTYVTKRIVATERSQNLPSHQEIPQCRGQSCQPHKFFKIYP